MLHGIECLLQVYTILAHSKLVSYRFESGNRIEHNYELYRTEIQHHIHSIEQSDSWAVAEERDKYMQRSGLPPTCVLAC